MKEKIQKVISLCLVLLMLVGLIPSKAFAAIKPADWNYQTVENKSDAWPLGAYNILRRVANAEGVKTPSISYVGYYKNAEGRDVLRISFNMFQNLATAVWKKLIIKLPENFATKVDWSKSGMYKLAFDGQAHDFNNDTRGISPFAKISRIETGSDYTYVQSLANNGNLVGGSARLSTPIDFVLNEGVSVTDFTEQVLVQARLVDDNHELVYTRASEKNPVASYNSYTLTTVLPLTNTDYDKELNPSLIGETPEPFYNTTSYITYDLDGGYIDVIYKQAKLATGNTIGTTRNQKNPLAVRQVFDKSFMDVLEERANGTVAEVRIWDAYDNEYPANPVISLKKGDFTTKNGLSYLQLAGNNWDDQYEGADSIKTKKIGDNPQDSILNGTTTELNSGVATRFRYYVNRDALANIIKGSGLKSFSFYSTVISGDAQGTLDFTTQSTSDIKLSKGDKISLEYNEPQGYIGGAGIIYDTNKMITIGNDDFSIDYYGSISMVPLRNAKIYTWTVPYDMIIPKDANISVKGVYNLKKADKQTLVMKKGNTELFKFSKPIVEHRPRIVKWSPTITGGAMVSTIYKPYVDEIFTDDKKITGASNYDRAEMTLAIPEGETLRKDQKFSAAKDETETVLRTSLKKDQGGIEVAEDKYVTYKGHKFDTSNPNAAGDAQLKKYQAIIIPTDIKKDTPVYVSNRAIMSASLDGSDVIEQVQAKVTFKPGGPLGDDVSYKKIAPLNKNYLYSYDEDTKKFTKNASYKANGFGELNDKGEIIEGTLDDIRVDTTKVVEVDGKKMINYLDHNDRPYDINAIDTSIANQQKQALLQRQWPEVVDKDGNKLIDGKLLIGWTSKKLEDDVAPVPEGERLTAAQKYFKLIEENKVIKELKDWEEAKKNAYVYNSKSPMDEAIEVYGVWAEPAIRLHSNFDKDDSKEGMQEYVDKQALEKSAIEKLKEKDADPSQIDATLKSVYEKAEFTRKGYSLVGFSRNKDAEEPDINVTGEGLTQDLYLRDGDKFKLAAKGTAKTKSGEKDYDYTFDVVKGLDLYAVWKKDFTVKASKKWFDKAGNALAEKAEWTKDLKFALIGRPAVGTFGYEVVVKGATYYPIQGTIKEYKPDGVTWENLKGYDAKGRRMSYIVVELKTPEQINAFKGGSTTWSDYNLKIEEMQKNPDGSVKHYGRKTQYIELGNKPDIDAFSAATIRKHTSKDHPEGVIPHAPGANLGYFDSTGYIIDVKNIIFDLIPPTINQAYEAIKEEPDEKDDMVYIRPPKRQLDEIEVKMPGNKKITLTRPPRIDPNKSYAQYVLDQDPAKSDAGIKVKQDEEGMIILGKLTPALKAGDKFVAVGVINAGGRITTREAEMIVKERLKSNKVTDISQEKYTVDKNNEEIVPIRFVVPEPTVTDKPIAGTVYTLLVEKDDGTFEDTSYKYTIPVEGAETTPGKSKTFNVPKTELTKADGTPRKIKIKAKEPNKRLVDSEIVTLDFKAPVVTSQDLRQERWRRWTNIYIQLDETPEGQVTLLYKENGQEKQKDFNSKSELAYEIERLKLKDDITDMRIKAADKYGNEDNTDTSYAPVEQTVIRIQRPLRNRNYVYVTTTEPNTRVTITVYKEGTCLDNYKQDKYFNYEGIDAQIKFKQEVDFATTSRQKIILNNYKFSKGDVVDIVGRIGTQGQKGFKITNPYTWIIK